MWKKESYRVEKSIEDTKSVVKNSLEKGISEFNKKLEGSISNLKIGTKIIKDGFNEKSKTLLNRLNKKK